MSLAVVTTVAGRRPHLARQLEGLQRQTRPADHLVIVRMDQQDVTVPPIAAEHVAVLDIPQQNGQLPLSAARNLGARATEAEQIVFLDVDCIPGASLVEAYAKALSQADGLVSGPLRYLEPDAVQDSWTEADLYRHSHQHPARPAPEPGEIVQDDRHELAWTTSLGINRRDFDRINGFDERFVGYGGEDTDFGIRAQAAGLGVWWSGDAVAFHQHHDTQSPPTRHLAAIVRNSALFKQIHGWYPMQGWLEEFRRRGLIDFDPAAGFLRLRPDR
ncbi:glycosyltransferase family 2 protein [Kineosporia babensis]|uniref:Glycosyltransferase n=1 Tax=Kineosporia babensis TaxID=499548 RepID=A0A9X1NJP2_9ACTN|nr:galactosyltransferase-related protein [Kineosporia babensis]MCD5316312.1 glycosyltransferase [Kineosporia babensis]